MLRATCVTLEASVGLPSSEWKEDGIWGTEYDHQRDMQEDGRHCLQHKVFDCHRYNNENECHYYE